MYMMPVVPVVGPGCTMAWRALQMYMMPEGSKSGTLRLYSTSLESFPKGWKLEKVLIDQPLIDASLVMPLKGGCVGASCHNHAPEGWVGASCHSHATEGWEGASRHSHATEGRWVVHSVTGGLPATGFTS